MNNKVALLLSGTAAVLALSGTSQAATEVQSQPVQVAQSYAELLAPVENATEQLKADDAARALQSPLLQLAQYYHHHQQYQRRHHHHHHQNYNFQFGFGPPTYYGRHCYWRWGRAYWNGYRWVRPRIKVCD